MAALLAWLALALELAGAQPVRGFFFGGFMVRRGVPDRLSHNYGKSSAIC